MAGTIAQSPGLASAAVVRVESGELLGGSSGKARRFRVSSAGVAGANLRAISGSSCSALGYLSSRESSRRDGGRRRTVAQASFEPLDLTGSSRAGYGRVAAPRLQDLDPNTMLLQQRIIFLGGQVTILSTFLFSAVNEFPNRNRIRSSSTSLKERRILKFSMPGDKIRDPSSESRKKWEGKEILQWKNAIVFSFLFGKRHFIGVN